MNGDKVVQLTGEANFNVGLVVRELIIVPKYWRQTEERKIELLQQLGTTLDGIFNIQTVLVVTNNPEHYAMTGGGSIDPESELDVITLSKTSFMTYLYMYAFILAKKGYSTGAEWAHTIFCLASRSTYFDSLSRGLFFSGPVPFVTPLEGAADKESVDEMYNQMVATLTDTNLVELTHEVDGD